MRLQGITTQSQGKARPEDRLGFIMSNRTVLSSPQYRLGTVVRGEVVDAETKERYPLVTSGRAYITHVVREMARNDITMPWPKNFREISGVRVNYTLQKGKDGKQYATNLVLPI